MEELFFGFFGLIAIILPVYFCTTSRRLPCRTALARLLAWVLC
jgi:hypothetical protein